MSEEEKQVVLVEETWDWDCGYNSDSNITYVPLSSDPDGDGTNKIILDGDRRDVKGSLLIVRRTGRRITGHPLWEVVE